MKLLSQNFSQSKMLRLRSLWSRVSVVITFGVLCLILPVAFVDCQSAQQQQQQQQQQQPQTQQRTQWFEDTIDDFLRAAQDNGETTDLQVSTCKISSQQLVATAQATAARVLKGVCNPTENEDRFRNLEVQLGDQLDALRTMVTSLEDKIASQGKELKSQYEKLLSAISTCNKRNDGGNCVPNDSSGSLPSSTTRASISSSSSSSGRSSGSNNRADEYSSPPHYVPRYIPSVPHRAEEVTHESEENQSFESSNTISIGGPRSAEIQKYNSTIHIENGKRVFSYYWIVSGIAYKLSSWNSRRALRSNSFYIYPRGYSMYLKIIPKYSTSTMYIHVGLTKGIYDDSLEWPFTSKMRVSVLAQDDAQILQDIKSRVWNPRDLCSGTNWRKPVYTDNPECVGLGFPHSVINTPDFILNDQIVIKLTVFLD